MKSCSQCDQTILFGGVQYRGERYCKKQCVERVREQFFAELSRRVPPAWAIDLAQSIFKSPCPRCKRSAPIDVRVFHGFYLEGSAPEIEYIVGCRRCGIKRQLGAALRHLFLGPLKGSEFFLESPVMIAENVDEMCKQDSDSPSDLIVSHCMMEIAATFENADVPSTFKDKSVYHFTYDDPVLPESTPADRIERAIRAGRR